eukprot:5833738-Pleurochrysis_carterae.AAC.1
MVSVRTHGFRPNSLFPSELMVSVRTYGFRRANPPPSELMVSVAGDELNRVLRVRAIDGGGFPAMRKRSTSAFARASLPRLD